MDHDTIIRLAREVWDTPHWNEAQTERLARFAAHVAAREREACAQIAEEWLGPTKDRELHIAAAIRSRT